MTRNVEILSAAIHGLSSTVEAWQKAGVLTPSEKRALHHALWSIVIAAEKERDIDAEMKELAARTAECI
jgi:hypothetical protein